MFKNPILAFVCLCLVAGGAQAQGANHEFVGTARKTLQNYEKAVITLSEVLKIEAQGREQEIKLQCAAAIIDPSGLAVASLGNVNPHGKIRVGGVRTLELETQVQEVKYRLGDGTELAARVVLKDEDLDLAFLALQKPLNDTTRAQIASIPLSDAAAQVQPMDATILIGRTNEDLNYTPLLIEGRILGILTQPRNCYIADGGVLGMPVFGENGRLLGLVCRCVKNEGSSSGSLRMQTVPTQLILPAADIARLVPQAKEEAKKAAEADKKAATKKKAADGKKKPDDSKKPDGKKDAARSDAVKSDAKSDAVKSDAKTDAPKKDAGEQKK
ncbi:MAG: serine protease [Thermoguttaceae bacterium]